VNNTQLNFR